MNQVDDAIHIQIQAVQPSTGLYLTDAQILVFAWQMHTPRILMNKNENNLLKWLWVKRPEPQRGNSVPGRDLYPDTTNGTSIFTYIGVVSGVNVGIYSSLMECLGYIPGTHWTSVLIGKTTCFGSPPHRGPSGSKHLFCPRSGDSPGSGNNEHPQQTRSWRCNINGGTLPPRTGKNRFFIGMKHIGQCGSYMGKNTATNLGFRRFFKI